MTLKNKINLSIIFLILVTIFCVIFIISPLFREIKKGATEIIFQRGDLAALEAKVKNLEKFRSSYQEIEPGLEKIDKLFIDPGVPVDFISFLEKTSQDCQILIKISPALPTKIEKDPWSSLIFQITSVSSFPNFLKFLEKLESSDYLIKVQNLNIVRLSEAELKSKEFEKFSLGDVKANFSLKVYTK